VTKQSDTEDASADHVQRQEVVIVTMTEDPPKKTPS